MNSSSVSTLARGVARQIHRESQWRDPVVVKIFSSRTKWIKYHTEALIRRAGLGYVCTHSDGRYVFILSIEPRSGGRLSLEATVLDTRKCDIFDSGYVPLIISRHALERMSMRLHIHTLKEYVEELRPVAERFTDMKIPYGQFALPSEHGLFLGYKENNTCTLTTFVDDAKLRPEQMERKQSVARVFHEAC